MCRIWVVILISTCQSNNTSSPNVGQLMHKIRKHQDGKGAEQLIHVPVHSRIHYCAFVLASSQFLFTHTTRILNYPAIPTSIIAMKCFGLLTCFSLHLVPGCGNSCHFQMLRIPHTAGHGRSTVTEDAIHLWAI